MKFIVEPNNGAWIAVRPELRKEALIERLTTADILVSDLDDTDTPSPAKAIARSGMLTPSYFKDPKFWLWAIGTKYHLARKGEGAESYRWSKFIETFLRDPEKLARLSEEYTPESAELKFYPGVRAFYNSLPLTLKVYLTRNIREVGEAYRRAAGFDEVLPEQFDKQKGIAKIVRAHPERKRFVIKGDSAEDEAVVDFLKSLKKKGEIEEVTPIYISNSPRNLNPRFDINIGRNYGGLVSLIMDPVPVQHA